MVLAALVILVAGAGLAGVLTAETYEHYIGLSEQQREKSEATAREAKTALLAYMLLRWRGELKIAAGSASSVEPRLLMPPCPDNVGNDTSDNNLDGTQDPTCGGTGGNAVNDILNVGSRFGRLPWRTSSAVKDTVSDGLGREIRDAYGDRLWYALARNIAPAKKTSDNIVPLNFHRLMTTEDGWLSVVDGDIETITLTPAVTLARLTITRRAAAVILTPGRADDDRLSEAVLQTGTYKYADDVKNPGDVLSPVKYFEGHTVTVFTVGILGTAVATVISYANHNEDGVFIKAAPREDFNDAIAYIDMRDLTGDGGWFFAAYKEVVGITEIHNKPAAASPLADIKRALLAYRALTGFYPYPAAQSATMHLNDRFRGCAAYHSGTAAISAELPAGVTLLTPSDISASAAATLLSSATLSLSSPAGFLPAHAVVITLSSSASAVVNDVTIALNTLTLARYARVELPAGARIAASVWQSVAVSIRRLSAGDAAVLASPATVAIAVTTPLSPSGDAAGWLPLYHSSVSMTAGHDRTKWTLAGENRATFLSGAMLTIAGATVTMTVTIFAGDVLTLRRDQIIRLEDDYGQLTADADAALTASVYRGGVAVTSFAGARPTRGTYNRRQFAVFLLTDATRATATVRAPALLYPWRDKATSDAISRDNLRAYPPCFDARDFYSRGFRLFLQDQPMVYAVAGECHYGGDAAACERGNVGLTVSIAAGASVALPRPVVLTHSLTLDIVSVTIAAGTVTSPGTVTLRHQIEAPIITVSVDGSVTVTITNAILHLPRDHVFTVSQTVIAPAGALLVGGAASHIRNVAALLIYSPAPLPRARCATDMPAAARTTITLSLTTPQTITLATQQTIADDITPFCYWLDDEENAAGDYIIRPPPAHAAYRRNDYMLLFGGDAVF